MGWLTETFTIGSMVVCPGITKTVPGYACCPSIIITKASFYSQKYPILYDKIYGHPKHKVICLDYLLGNWMSVSLGFPLWLVKFPREYSFIFLHRGKGLIANIQESATIKCSKNWKHDSHTNLGSSRFREHFEELDIIYSHLRRNFRIRLLDIQLVNVQQSNKNYKLWSSLFYWTKNYLYLYWVKSASSHITSQSLST